MVQLFKTQCTLAFAAGIWASMVAVALEPGGGLVRRLLRQHALADGATGAHANNREGRSEQKRGENRDARVLT